MFERVWYAFRKSITYCRHIDGPINQKVVFIIENNSFEIIVHQSGKVALTMKKQWWFTCTSQCLYTLSTKLTFKNYHIEHRLETKDTTPWFPNQCVQINLPQSTATISKKAIQPLNAINCHCSWYAMPVGSNHQWDDKKLTYIFSQKNNSNFMPRTVKFIFYI